MATEIRRLLKLADDAAIELGHQLEAPSVFLANADGVRVRTISRRVDFDAEIVEMLDDPRSRAAALDLFRRELRDD